MSRVLMRINVRMALKNEDRERSKGTKPDVSILLWEEAFRCWREDVIRSKGEAHRPD